MINAEIATQKGDLLFVRFSKPNEDFGKTSFTQVQSREEINRILYFKNRQYVTGTLLGWLNQRNHALNYSNPTTAKLINFIQGIEKNSFQYICMVIGRFRKDFESVAPSKKSRFYNHYQTNILPILDYCNS